jgi:hypothetical protein
VPCLKAKGDLPITSQDKINLFFNAIYLKYILKANLKILGKIYCVSYGNRSSTFKKDQYKEKFQLLLGERKFAYMEKYAH